MISHVVVFVDFSGKDLPRPRVLTMDTNAANKLLARNIELKSTPAGGVSIYKINGRHAPSGQKSIAKIITGVARTRRLKTAGINNYTRAAFNKLKAKAPTPIRKTSKKRTAKKKVIRKTTTQKNRHVTKITIIETSDPAVIKKYV